MWRKAQRGRRRLITRMSDLFAADPADKLAATPIAIKVKVGERPPPHVGICYRS